MSASDGVSYRQKQEWKWEQERLKRRLITEDDFPWTLPASRNALGEEGTLRYVGGVDVSFLKDDPDVACGALVVLDIRTLRIVYEDFTYLRLDIPYAAGFLGFREVPVLLPLLEKLKRSRSEYYPQLVMVDGNGLHHYRGFGSACHLGVLANLPTIGVAKNLLFMDGLTDIYISQLIDARENRGKDFITLKGRSGRTWGAVTRSSNPIYVSIGHRISLDTALEVVKLTRMYRLPEPIRQADLRSREFLRQNPLGIADQFGNLSLQRNNTNRLPNSSAGRARATFQGRGRGNSHEVYRGPYQARREAQPSNIGSGSGVGRGRPEQDGGWQHVPQRRQAEGTSSGSWASVVRRGN